MSRESTIDLSIVIPALNEARRIGHSLEELADFIKTDRFLNSKSIEVVVVVADSSDDTLNIVRSKASKFDRFQVLTPGVRVGKGRDVRAGVLAAGGRKILFMDADLATPLTYIEQFYRRIDGGYELVIGVRNLKVYRRSLLRRLFSMIGNLLFMFVSGVLVSDSQCGFKMFNAKAASLCFNRLQILGWSFDMELLAIARSNKLKICPEKIKGWQDMPYSTFNESLAKIIGRSLWDLTLILGRRLNHSYTGLETSELIEADATS